MNEDVTVATSDQMRDLGRRLAGLLRAGDLIIVSGPLGAGKTTLTQGIGEALSVRGPVTSPTFVISRVHPRADGASGPALVHVDAYRLGSALELDDLDLDADTDTAVTVVEWGEGIAEGLADDRLEVTISRTGDLHEDASIDGDRPRTVRILGVGSRWRDIRLARTDVIDRL
jgi:tRNA threonylcarbamoyladenosine biosynthesis protein TsaE